MAKSAVITGWGHYVPQRVLTNKELEAHVDTSDEWIRKRTGIRERRIAGPGETTGTMCTEAARQALARARLDPRDLDLVICSATTPDYLLPATSCLIQEEIGAVRAAAFDVNTACTGFVYSLVIAQQFVLTGTYNRVLVTGGETLTRFMNWKDRSTCILFGDGAGAAIVEATDQPGGILSTVLGSKGDIERLLAIEAGGAALPASADTIAKGQHCVVMRGNELFKFAVRTMAQAARDALAKAKLKPADVRMVIPHQANMRILKATQESLGLPLDKLYLNIDRYGNTAAASVPIALSEFLSQDSVRPGDNLLLVSFGGGLTWAAAIVQCVDVPAVIAARRTGRERANVSAPVPLAPIAAAALTSQKK
jgi:3-oxoacyl-[acyl-carrier-protein] synthase-3